MISTIDKAKGYFVFREAASVAELEALLRLRYRVYRDCKLARFVAKNPCGIDLDCYDIRSRHFGLFKVAGGMEAPVGYLRVTEDGIASGAERVVELADRYPGFAAKISQTPSFPLPLMTYFPDSDVLGDVYAQIKDWGERLVEPCRLALDRSFRSIKIGKHVIESAIVVYFFARKIEHAVGCCDSATKRFYGRYGFRQLPGTCDGDFAGLDRHSTCVFGSAENVPDPLRERLNEMTKAYKSTGRICCHPDNPDLYYDLDRVASLPNSIARFSPTYIETN